MKPLTQNGTMSDFHWFDSRTGEMWPQVRHELREFTADRLHWYNASLGCNARSCASSVVGRTLTAKFAQVASDTWALAFGNTFGLVGTSGCHWPLCEYGLRSCQLPRMFSSKHGGHAALRAPPARLHAHARLSDHERDADRLDRVSDAL